MTPPDYPFPGGSPLEPSPRLAELRATEPVSRVLLAGEPAILLTRHADVRAAMADPGLAAHILGIVEGTDDERAAAAESGFLMLTDGDAHRRLRRPLAGAMSARRIAALRAGVENRARELVACVVATGGGELLRDLAAPLAIVALGGVIGVDVTARPDFARWSADAAAFVDSDAETMAQGSAALFGFVAELVAAERDGAGLVGDLFRLVPEDGIPLTDAEVTGLVGQLLMAGYQPTALVLALGARRLLTAPDVAAAARAERASIPGLVDELLRLDPGAAGNLDRTLRARTEVTLPGVRVRPGELVVLPLGAANRDPDVFADPDRIDPDRRPNPHLSFHAGPHHCVGAALARITLGAMIGALLDAPAPIVLAGEPSWRPGPLGETQLAGLPVRVDAHPHPNEGTVGATSPPAGSPRW